MKGQRERFDIGGAVLEADIKTVPGARGIVVFVHGSGSSRSRHSAPGNQFVARVLRLEIVEGASHLFDESGTLEQAAERAADWFARYLKGE